MATFCPETHKLALVALFGQALHGNFLCMVAGLWLNSTAPPLETLKRALTIILLR